MTALTVKMKPRLLLTKCRTIHSHIYKQAAGCLSYLPRAANAKHMKQKQPIQYSMHCDLGIVNGTPWFENFKLFMPPFKILLNPQKLEKQQNRKLIISNKKICKAPKGKYQKRSKKQMTLSAHSSSLLSKKRKTNGDDSSVKTNSTHKHGKKREECHFINATCGFCKVLALSMRNTDFGANKQHAVIN